MITEDFNHFGRVVADLGGLVQELLDNTAESAVSHVQGRIVANGQVKTGEMLKSVHVEPGDDANERLVVVGVPYGIYQNYGTRFIPARPFMEPGIDDTRGKMDDLLENAAVRLEGAAQ